MDNNFNLIIIGAGSAGIGAALEAISRDPSQKILLIEQVKRLHDTRNVSNGWMGGSAKSDLRLFTSPSFGGELKDNALFDALLAHLQPFTKTKFRPIKNKLSKKFVKKMNEAEIEVDEPTTYIVGSERLIQIENQIQYYLNNLITIRSNCRVEHIAQHTEGFEVRTNNKTFYAKKCILAMGRGGANWLSNISKDFEIPHTNNSFDLGIRLEFPHTLIKSITEKQGTFRLRFDEYRTSCLSTYGTVEMENVEEYKTANGRTISGKETHYSSFSVLKTFEQDDALNKVLRLVSIANILADGQLLREPVTRILTDTSVLSPIEEYASLKTGILKLFAAWPEIATRCTLYAPEARLNTIRYDLSKHMETNIPGLYIIGDMSGKTKSFSQSACSGIVAARHAVRNKTKGTRGK